MRWFLHSLWLLSLNLSYIGAVAAPLTLPDNPSVFERVIINDTMNAYEAADPSSRVIGDALALRPYYVFERRSGWVRLGRTSRDEDLFWVDERGTTPWPHNIVLTFTTRGLPGQALFFESLDTLKTVLDDETPTKTARLLRSQAIAAGEKLLAGEYANAGPVNALGPEEGIDASRNFYYLPILDFEDDLYFNDDFTEALALEVSILKKRPANAPAPLPSEEYRAAVAFVIDTTSSMEPYLLETKRTVSGILRKIQDGPAAEKVSFALIGFRDSTDARPGVEYVTRAFLPFSGALDAAAFDQAMDLMVDSKESTLHFREDAYAGVMQAANALDWSPYSARWIVLVTDASSRSAEDPYSSTKRNAQGLASYIRTNLQAGLITLHLKTPEGTADHDRAESQYRILSMPGNDGPLYFAINVDTPEEMQAAYGRAADFVTRTLVRDVVSFKRSKGATPVRYSQSDEADLNQLGERVGRLAQAFRLNYLGKVASTSAPDLLSGWVLDRDYAQRSKKPFDIRLLVTRNELDSLSKAIDDVIALEQDNQIDGAGLFDAISGAAAKMARAPDDVATAVEGSDVVGGISNIPDLERLLLSLPYESESMTIVELGWDSLSSDKQEKYLNSLYEKQAAYRAHYDDADAWVRLHPEDTDGDMVFPIPLDDLP